MAKTRFMMPAAVHVLFMKDDKLLLSQRKNISFDGLYGLVAGHLDGEETVTAAAIREAKEEIGVDVDRSDIEIAGVCHSHANNKEVIQFYTICKKWQGEIINNEPEKCSDLKFFSINALPETIVPYVKDAINKVTKGIRYFEYGWNGES